MAQKILNLIIFLSLSLLFACNSETNNTEVRNAQLLLGNGRVISVTLAISPEDQQKGLSGLKNEQFPDEDGMFFYYKELGPKRFWMPDTYFNLDIFFLDQTMKVIAVERNVPAHPGREEIPPIAQTKTYLAKHVLELKSSSQSAKMIGVGDILTWKNSQIPSQIESSIRQKK